jgi:hypothetical protein
VIAVDTNILVYAHRSDSPWHGNAKACIAALAASTQNWTIPWPCAHEFLSIVTNLRIYAQPTPAPLAFEQLVQWQKPGGAAMIGEGPGHLGVLAELCKRGAVGGGAIHDARVAAICIDNGVSELWTADRDFARFPALKTRNPLVS